MDNKLFLVVILRRTSKTNVNIVYVLLGISPASNCIWPTFRNPVSVPSSKAGCRVLLYIQPLNMELTQGSETSANYNLTPGKYPKEHIQYSNHGESLKSRKVNMTAACISDTLRASHHEKARNIQGVPGGMCQTSGDCSLS